MKVLIDTSPLANKSANRGIGRYTRELVDALRALHTDHTFFTSDDRVGNVDIVHYPFFDLFFPTLPFLKRTKTIVTIHDVIPLVFPRHYPVGIRGKLGLLHQKLSLISVKHVITDSLCSKRDIVDHLGVKPDLITSVPLAASQLFVRQSGSVIDCVRKKYDIPKNYVLYVGDINYNKNVPFLIRVIARIPDVTLVLVGKAMKNSTIPEGRAIAKAVRESGSEKNVRLLDTVGSLDDLVAIYSGAKVYVQPSLYEGFGLPVIEAMRCKVPVVSSCGGSLAEIVNEAGFQFNPQNEQECEAAIRKALRMSSEERVKMMKYAFEYSNQFTWERTARETIAIYEKIMRQ